MFYVRNRFSIAYSRFNGFALTFIWIIEFSFILGIPILFVFKRSDLPYSEKLNSWYPKFTLSYDFESIPTARRILDRISVNAFEALNELQPGMGNRHTKIHLFYLKDEEQQFISMDRIYPEGQGRNKVDNLFSNLIISSAEARAILEKYHHKKEIINVF